jgi:eukaryotic-like serine/threonine-protein kinase
LPDLSDNLAARLMLPLARVSSAAICPFCGSTVVPESALCDGCGKSIADTGTTSVSSSFPESVTELPTFGGALPDPRSRTSHRQLLSSGDRFGPRYTILKLLGVGGMGAVYQARDSELAVAVALKVIRPPDGRVTADLERRFVRELVLARQVTHKNVIRIHDLGEVDGTKYISMPFVEGADLAKVLHTRGALPIAETLRLVRQVADGLSAAHEAGVIHRDLKPGNILVNEEFAIITDFGIANSVTNAAEDEVIGTARYMAPEQARGEGVSHRADIYAFGLILFQMLAGRCWNADIFTEEILAGSREAFREYTPRSDWPNGINRVLSRCLAIDPLKRYGSGAMLVDDLSTLDASGHIVARPSFFQVPSSWPVIGGRLLARGTAIASIALLLAVPVVGGVAYVTSARVTRNALIQPERKSILVADIANRTGDPIFDGIAEPVLTEALERASFIDSYPRRDAKALVTQIARGEPLDTAHARVIAQREGINAVLGGSITKQGSGYRVAIDVIDPISGTVLSSRTATARGRDDVLRIVGDVGDSLRSALGDTAPESAQLSGRETFTASSLEAARAYSEGQDLLNASQYAASVPKFEKAVMLDPRFGRAFASWAVAASALGQRGEAERLYKQAFSVTDRMSERERLRTYGTYYLTVAQAYEEAVTNYTKLVELYPADRAAHGDLAVAYFYTLNFAKALEAGRRALSLYPAATTLRNNVALYAMYSGDFNTAAQEATRVLEADSTYFRAYTPLVVSAILTRSQPAAPLYERMAATGPVGASRAATGLADLAMYEGRYSDAARMLPAAIAKDQTRHDLAGVAIKSIVLAEASLAIGSKTRAAVVARQAVAADRGESVLFAAGRVLIGAGETDAAERLADELRQRTEGYSRVYADILKADLALTRRAPADAVEALRAAQRAADLWLVNFQLGVAYVGAGRFPEAIAAFDRCVLRRGEATVIFLDGSGNDIPSVRYLATLPYWHARAQEGLGLRSQAAENYRQFLTVRTAADDPLTRDARSRVSKLGAKEL